VAGKDEVGVRIFNKKDVDEFMIKSSENLSVELSKYGTIESINSKIINCKNISIANMYNVRYTNLLNLLDKYTPMPDEVENKEDTEKRGYVKGSFIEGLIGLNLLALYLENDDREKVIGITPTQITEIISKFEVETNTSRKLISDMAKISSLIFDKYWNAKIMKKRKRKC
jgi:hypothetical protein